MLLALALIPPLLAAPEMPMPLQPFTVELLDLQRGRWEFVDALGQHLKLAGPVAGYAFPGTTEGEVRLGYLCCDPEFPEDLAHAELRFASGEGDSLRIEEPSFAANVQVSLADGVARVTLHDIALGPAVTGDRYLAALYVLVGEEAFPVWLAPDDSEDGLSPRLLTDRVGHVFTEGEPVRVTLAASWRGRLASRHFALEVSDYATGERVFAGEVELARAEGLARGEIELPLTRFGVFELTATTPGLPPAKLRVCRIPEPRAVEPESSSIGINLFQQQIWWYGHQAPMMAKAGVRWIRPWLAWENLWSIQQPEEGTWDTRALDSALNRMESLGQRYQTILWRAPDWATGGAEYGAPPVERMDAWAAYVEELTRRYRGRIRHYEVWNEPDLMWPEGTRHSAEHYFAMLKESYAAAKRGDPDCVVLGLSFAGYEQWLRNLGDLGPAAYMDIATIHIYGEPRDFASTWERRHELLAAGGMGDKPVWINELGATAYDFSPEYSAKFACSERSQAATLTQVYAEALSFDPAMKAYWFCTLDPRDPAHESQWTGDAGIGVLYLGLLPKLSYAALAGTAHMLDGRVCLGRAEIGRGMHQVSFEEEVAVVWRDGPASGEPVAATELGCLPEERIRVRDGYTNLVAEGPASEVTLDFSRGPLYLQGSRQMAAIARCESALRVSPSVVALEPGGSAEVTLSSSPTAKLTIELPPDLPVEPHLGPGRLRLVVEDRAERAAARIGVRVAFAEGTMGLLEPYEARRWISVSIGAPNRLTDGGFDEGALAEWTPERASPYRWDAEVGHRAPGSLRLDGPFDRRLVRWRIEPTPGRDLCLRAWVRTEGLAGCLAGINAAFFGPDAWLGTWGLASTEQPVGVANDWRLLPDVGRIPSGDSEWTLVEARLPAASIPEGANHIGLFVDAKGGEGTLWLDDLDLWQPEG